MSVDINLNNRRHNKKELRERPHVMHQARNVRYYSSTDAEIYFGNTRIIEVVAVAWSVQQQQMPIYGYNSYTFDDLALGSRIVQGQFTINFTESGFVEKAIYRLRENNKNTSRRSYGEDKLTASIFTDANRNRRNRPVFDTGFDILVGYGEKNGDKYNQYLTLEACQIVNLSSQLDVNGDPILETYAFIARDIISPGSNSPVIKDNHNSTDNKLNGNNGGSTSTILNKEYSKIFMIEPNKRISLSLSNGQSAPEKSSIIITGLDDDSFRLGKTLKNKNGVLEYNLLFNEVLSINNYMDKYSTDKIEGTFRYYRDGKSFEEVVILSIVK